MQGDFSRNTFNKAKHFSRVLMQQGRVQLDADWNEQVSILLHFWQALAENIIGPHGGPKRVVLDTGGTPKLLDFEVKASGADFEIGEGYYYVSGIRCENDSTGLKYTGQLPGPTTTLSSGKSYVVYLEVWEQHTSYVEDENSYTPGIREVALGGVDTATRAKVVWQVKIKEITLDSQFKTNLAALPGKIQSLNNSRSTLKQKQDALLPIASSAFEEFKPIIKKVNEVIQPLNNDIGELTDDISDPPDVSSVRQIVTKLNQVIAPLNNNITPLSLPANPNDKTLGDQTVIDLITKLNFVIEIEKLNATISGLEVEIADLRRDIEEEKKRIESEVLNLPILSAAKLAAQAQQPSPAAASVERCAIPGDARYRGMENQLYRVEIHEGGGATAATFKWSRENGSVIFPILSVSGNIFNLADLGRDSRLSLEKGDWVELVNDDLVLERQSGPLLKVENIDPLERKVWLKLPSDSELPNFEAGKHPLLRRWDHKKVEENKLSKGAIKISQATNWFELEDGVEVKFEAGGQYYTGDYWLIPARTAIWDIEWPKKADGTPNAVEPHGVEHYYAPLAIVSVASGGVTVEADCRRLFNPLGQERE
jgi:hypothetical protein